MIPVIAFSAWSGTGKTTIIEKTIAALKSKGLHVAVIKHDAHDFEIDKEGKDSWRFSHAGADMTVISSKSKTAIIENRSLDLDNILSMIHDVDMIILEGYNSISSADEHTQIIRIGLARKETGQGFRHPLSEYAAVATDFTQEELTSLSDSGPVTIPVFSLEDIPAITEFLINMK